MISMNICFRLIRNKKNRCIIEIDSLQTLTPLTAFPSALKNLPHHRLKPTTTSFITVGKGGASGIAFGI